jgi:glycosyltransferase involved in cell wall biosynthesis
MDLSARPLLSVVTVVFNDADNLAATIASIKSQSFQDLELIVIDGGSRDGTLEVVRASDSVIGYWISEPDKGLYDAMNKGIKAARGKYLEFLNAGDTYTGPDALKCIFGQNDGDYDVLYGEINLFDPNDQFLFRVPAQPFTLENVRRYGTGTLNHQAFFIKRSVAPLFSTRYRLKAELNWYIDILEEQPALSYKHIAVPVINYRQGGKGYREFWRNLFEWIKLVQRRFGLAQNMRNVATYWTFIKYRYPPVGKVFSPSLWKR